MEENKYYCENCWKLGIPWKLMDFVLDLGYFHSKFAQNSLGKHRFIKKKAQNLCGNPDKYISSFNLKWELNILQHFSTSICAECMYYTIMYSYCMYYGKVCYSFCPLFWPHAFHRCLRPLTAMQGLMSGAHIFLFKPLVNCASVEHLYMPQAGPSRNALRPLIDSFKLLSFTQCFA